jgi:hypothetical protein
MADFVNRVEELSRLQTLYESAEAELAVIFGRRRLGKTALIKHSLEKNSLRDINDMQQSQKPSKQRWLACPARAIDALATLLIGE